MSKPKLTFACGMYDRMVPLYTREVVPEGIDLEFIVEDDPREIFDAMAERQAYDLAEFSASEFVSRLAAGQCPFVALPVFASRSFRHGLITINRRSGITSPKDLEGRRVGVPLYTMTAAVFIRGHLQHEYGVDLDKIHWVQGSINRSGHHGNPTVMPLVRPVPIEINQDARSLNELLADGDLDAIVGTSLPKAMKHNPDIQRLFPDYRTVEREYFQRTGIFPVMHVIALRKEVHEAYPFVAKSLYDAFCKSKDIALAKMKFLGALRYMLPWLATELEEIDQVFGGDPWPYGVGANRASLDALVTYMAEQGLTDRKMPLEEVFVDVGDR